MTERDKNLYSLINPIVKEILLKEVKEDDLCLDVGCGPGQYRLIIPGRYIGLDITSKDYREGLSRRVDVVADGQDLPFKDNSFDVVFIVAALYQIPDTDKVLHGVFRILKDGGRFLIFDYNYYTTKRLKEMENRGVNKNHIWSLWGLQKIVKKVGFQAKIVYLYGFNRRRKLKKILSSFRILAYLQFLIRQLLFEDWNII